MIKRKKQFKRELLCHVKASIEMCVCGFCNNNYKSHDFRKLEQRLCTMYLLNLFFVYLHILDRVHAVNSSPEHCQGF